MAGTARIPLEFRDVALLKLFFADAATDDDAARLVRELKNRSVAGLAELRAQEQPSAELAETCVARFPSIALRVGIALQETLIAVADEIARELEAEGAQRR